MKKQVLKLDTTPRFELFGIVCPMRGYTLASRLNTAMGCRFLRVADIELSRAGGAETAAFPVFEYTDNAIETTFQLIGNKSSTVLLPSHSTIDFFYKIEGTYQMKNAVSFLTELRKIKGIQVAIQLDPLKIKNWNHLIF